MEINKKLMDEIINRLKEKTGRPYLEMSFDRNRDATLTESKLGGFPYVPEGGSIPKDPDRNPMYLLIQLNFKDMPKLDDYPDSGILQIFIADNDLLGVELDLPDKQDTWKAVYYKTVAKCLPEEKIREMSADPDEIEYTPFGFPGCGFPINFTEKEMFVSGSDFNFQSIVDSCCADIVPSEFKRKDGTIDTHNSGIDDAVDKMMPNNLNSVGGYPYFTQSDPRGDGCIPEDAELFLQIDTDTNSDPVIMWGDSGIANFFIRKEDLKNKDFSKLGYHWDCG